MLGFCAFIVIPHVTSIQRKKLESQKAPWGLSVTTICFLALFLVLNRTVCAVCLTGLIKNYKDFLILFFRFKHVSHATRTHSSI